MKVGWSALVFLHLCVVRWCNLHCGVIELLFLDSDPSGTP